MFSHQQNRNLGRAWVHLFGGLSVLPIRLAEKVFFFILIAGGLFPAFSSVAQGDDNASHFDWSQHEPKWHGTLSGEFKAGTSRHISQLGFTMPVSQTDSSMLILDFRGKMDDAQNKEINLGLAYRTLLASDWIFGLYGFFDKKRSPYGNEFNQATFGFELLSEDWDFRVNGYIPDLKGQDAGPAPGFGTLSIAGNQLLVNTQRLEECAYYGGDYEVGKLMKTFGDNENEIRLYGGGFYFDNDAPGYPHIAGPRMRLEARLFDVSLLGEGSRVTLSGELQWDQVRETEAFAGIGVQIPLGKWGGGGETPFGAGNRYSGLSRLERRMYDPIVRDVDIVSNSHAVGKTEVALDAEGDAIFVASADSSIEQAVANAGVNGTVAVHGAIETLGNVQLLNGQRLISAAAAVQTVVGAESGIRVRTSMPGARGVINGTDPTTPVILLTDNVIVDTLEINGGFHGLSGDSLNGSTIDGNVISGARSNGVNITTSFRGMISNNLIKGNAGHGLNVVANSGVIKGNTATSNGNYGVTVYQNSGVITGNTATTNSSGIFAGSNSGTISENTAVSNKYVGISASDNTGVVSKNIAASNSGNGFYVKNNRGEIEQNESALNSTNWVTGTDSGGAYLIDLVNGGSGSQGEIVTPSGTLSLLSSATLFIGGTSSASFITINPLTINSLTLAPGILDFTSDQFAIHTSTVVPSIVDDGGSTSSGSSTSTASGGVTYNLNYGLDLTGVTLSGD